MYEYNLAESEGFEPSRRFYTAYTISNRAPSASSDSSPAMAPQAGFEPATDRLTADSSTTELLWNNQNCLAASYSRRANPTTIGAKELNFRVRYGNGCDLFAIATRLFFLKAYSFKTR